MTYLHFGLLISVWRGRKWIQAFPPEPGNEDCHIARPMVAALQEIFPTTIYHLPSTIYHEPYLISTRYGIHSKTGSLKNWWRTFTSPRMSKGYWQCDFGVGFGVGRLIAEKLLEDRLWFRQDQQIDLGVGLQAGGRLGGGDGVVQACLDSSIRPSFLAICPV